MKPWMWKVTVVLAFSVVIVWNRIDSTRMNEQYRVLTQRQERSDQEQARLDRLIEYYPVMLDVAFERYYQRMVAYMEGRRDD